MPNQGTMLINTLLLAMAMALFSVGAKASLVGQNVTFSFLETGQSDLVESGPGGTGITVVDPGVELDGGDGNAIAAGFVMSSNESIDIFDDRIVFTIEGFDLVPNTGNPPLYLPFDLFEADARYEISGFDNSVLNPATLFSLSTSNVWADAGGVNELALGTQVLVDTTSNIITLFVAALHIGEISGAPNLAQITLNIDNSNVGVIPIPAALPLMLSGLALIGWLTRRRPCV